MSGAFFKSLRAKIFAFYTFIFVFVFGAALSANYMIFDNYLKNTEIKKVNTIADLIASNIAAPLQLGLSADVRVEMVKQIDKNQQIVEIEIKDLTTRELISTGFASGKRLNSQDFFVVDRDIYDALGIQKTATMRIYYSKNDLESAQSFVAKTIFLLFGAALIIGLAGLFRINSFFIPLKNLAKKLNDFDPEHPNIKLELKTSSDEISVIQNSVSLALDKLVSYQKRIIHVNEMLEDAVRERTRELNEQIELFRVLSDASPNAILMFDTNLIYANQAFVKMTGYESAEIFRLKPASFFETTEDDELFRALDVSNPRNKRHIHTFDEVTLVKKDGSAISVGASIAYLHIKDRDAAIINLVDLTAVKQKDRMLLVQSRFVAMGEMIGNIAHQWRQPLNIIQSSITKISIYKDMGLITDEFLDETVQAVRKQVMYLSSTIDDFRSFHKDDQVGIFSLKEATDKALSLTEAVYQNHFIEVVRECNGCAEEGIKGSMNRLIQALLNILNNSKDAIILSGTPHKVVQIKCKKANGRYILTIQDSGGGIDKKNLNKIFDPYFTTKNRSQGTGIGLYMTKQIIESSFGGKIEARNGEFEYNGTNLKGAVFTIEL